MTQQPAPDPGPDAPAATGPANAGSAVPAASALAAAQVASPLPGAVPAEPGPERFMADDPTATLWDWRRRVADLYATIRAERDPRRAWALWRDTRAALFRDHPQSPIEADGRAAYRGPALYPYDPALRFAVALRPPAEPEVLELPAGADGSVTLDAFACTEGLHEALGGELTLYWLRGYGGGVFLPFADATSGRETYGAGRYLLDTIKSADLGRDGSGRTVLDFNFSYFPSCAYSPRYTCPLAPRANRLPVPVRAGERLPEG